MAEVTEVKPCSNPGCDQPGTKSCSACKTTVYCCVICQTADWTHHKEECDGHLRKVGKANLEKARGFVLEQNWVQSLRYGEIAATKLKQLKDRRLETVLLINDALTCKFNALNFMARDGEAKECAEERYTLWAMNQMRNRGSIYAAFGLIQSCLHNKEFEDAERYTRHAMFMINEMTDDFIPSDQRTKFLADGSYYLARSIHRLAMAGGIPPEEKQKAGEEAIELARQALKLHTQLHGTENDDVAGDRPYLPMYWTTSTMLTTMRSFDSTSSRTPSRDEWRAVRLITWLQARARWELHIISGQKEHMLPMIWTDAWLIWSWHFPIFGKHFGSFGPSITWTVPTKLSNLSLVSRSTFNRSESPEQQQQQHQQHRPGVKYILNMSLG